MTPEQEQKLDHLIRLNTDLANHVGAVVQRVGALERGHKVLRAWVRKLAGPDVSTPPREPLPSLGADDSGAIDLSILGSKASFRGKWPVRIGAGLVISAALLAGGALLHMAMAKVSPPKLPVIGAGP